MHHSPLYLIFKCGRRSLSQQLARQRRLHRTRLPSWHRLTPIIFFSAQVPRLAPFRRSFHAFLRCSTHRTQRRHTTTDAARRALIFDTSTRQWIRSPSTKLNLNLGALQRLGGREAKTESLLDPAETQLEQRPVTTTATAESTEGDNDMLAGIALPKRPEPPGEEDCCQSGCAICVYDIYADDLESFELSVKQAREKLEPQWTSLKASGHTWPGSVLGRAPDEPDYDAESDKSQAEKQGEAARQASEQLHQGNSNPAMASRDAFAALERKLNG